MLCGGQGSCQLLTEEGSQALVLKDKQGSARQRGRRARCSRVGAGNAGGEAEARALRRRGVGH